MKEKEGLIIMGCGGDLQEWVDSMNEVLTKSGILLNDTRFDSVSAFQYNDMTCLLFPFDDVELSYGKIAMWRLQTHDELGGTWLSDFVPNRLGGFIGETAQKVEKPDCALIGQDSNIFNLVGIAVRTLRQHGQAEHAKEMSSRAFASGNYAEAFGIIGEYVNITSTNDPERKHSVRDRLKDTNPNEHAPQPKGSKQQER